ncbi:MAG: P-loop containing nucleoside triphosphate hydrolase protein, partial [Olpidium bornovanus]
LYISGRQHPVKIYNAAEPQTDYLDAALVTVFQIHADCGSGDILVFLAGEADEIESLASIINEQAATLPPEASKILVCPIFAALPTNQQAKVFEPAPPGTRKVILATNIAETSITISGVRYVVDTGVSKMRAYNPKLVLASIRLPRFPIISHAACVAWPPGIESLTIQPISRASARQRAGRAGREMPGFCYRLYTENSFFDDLPEDTEPEIRRCNLASVILLLKAAGVDDPVSFDFMDKPSRESRELRFRGQLRGKR